MDIWRLLFGTTRVGQGMTVKRFGRDHHIVDVKGRKAKIYTEWCTREVDFVVEPSSIEGWLPPHEREQMTEEEKEIVVEALYRYLDANRYRYSIDA